MSSRYSYGAALEYRVRDHLEQEGYYVIRSAGSGGVADLVALDMYVPAPPVMIQVKRVKGTMSVDAWNHLFRTANAVGAIPVLAVEHPTKALVYSLQRITAPRKPRRQAAPDQWEIWPLVPAEDRLPPPACRHPVVRDEDPQLLTDFEAEAEGVPRGTAVINSTCTSCGEGVGSRVVPPVVHLDNTEAVFTPDPIGPTTRIPYAQARCGAEGSTRVPCPVHRPEAFEPVHTPLGDRIEARRRELQEATGHDPGAPWIGQLGEVIRESGRP